MNCLHPEGFKQMSEAKDSALPCETIILQKYSTQHFSPPLVNVILSPEGHIKLVGLNAFVCCSIWILKNVHPAPFFLPEMET